MNLNSEILSDFILHITGASASLEITLILISLMCFDALTPVPDNIHSYKSDSQKIQKRYAAGILCVINIYHPGKAAIFSLGKNAKVR